MLVEGDRCIGSPIKLTADQCPAEGYSVMWSIVEGAQYVSLSSTSGRSIEATISEPKVPVIITYECCEDI